MVAAIWTGGLSKVTVVVVVAASIYTQWLKQEAASISCNQLTPSLRNKGAIDTTKGRLGQKGATLKEATCTSTKCVPHHGTSSDYFRQRSFCNSDLPSCGEV
jgi:hypothetical protein